MKKNVLITGASRGIGKEIAVGLASDYNLFLTARNEEFLSEFELKNVVTKYRKIFHDSLPANQQIDNESTNKI